MKPEYASLPQKLQILNREFEQSNDRNPISRILKVPHQIRGEYCKEDGAERSSYDIKLSDKQYF